MSYALVETGSRRCRPHVHDRQRLLSRGKLRQSTRTSAQHIIVAPGPGGRRCSCRPGAQYRSTNSVWRATANDPPSGPLPLYTLRKSDRSARRLFIAGASPDEAAGNPDGNKSPVRVRDASKKKEERIASYRPRFSFAAVLPLDPSSRAGNPSSKKKSWRGCDFGPSTPSSRDETPERPMVPCGPGDHG